ncbi:MAG TPA: diguanylate cyclase [Firmicutes bacterium]|nr:diguanylate cyclase [Bacillota bacterium]
MERINGRYTIQKEMAKGEFGVIYQVLDSDDPKCLLKSMKIYNSDKMGDSWLGQFKREYKYLSEIFLPCVVKVYDFDSIHTIDGAAFMGNYCFYTMEYLEYPSLFELWQKNEIEDPDAVLQSVGHYLSLMHQYDYVHGDLNLKNILLTPDHNVIFIDLEPGEEAEKDINDFREITELLNPTYHSSTVLPDIDFIFDRFSFTLDMVPEIKEECVKLLNQLYENEGMTVSQLTNIPSDIILPLEDYIRMSLQAEGYVFIKISGSKTPYSVMKHFIHYLFSEPRYQPLIRKDRALLQHIMTLQEGDDGDLQISVGDVEITGTFVRLFEELSYYIKPVIFIDGIDFTDAKSIEILKKTIQLYSGKAFTLIFHGNSHFISEGDVQLTRYFTAERMNETQRSKELVNGFLGLFESIDMQELKKYLSSAGFWKSIAFMINLKQWRPYFEYRDGALVFSGDAEALFSAPSYRRVIDNLLELASSRKLLSAMVYFKKPVRKEFLKSFFGPGFAQEFEKLKTERIIAEYYNAMAEPADYALYEELKKRIRQLPLGESEKNIKKVLAVYERGEGSLSDNELSRYIQYLLRLEDYKRAADVIQRLIYFPEKLSDSEIAERYREIMEDFYQSHGCSFECITQPGKRAVIEILFIRSLFSEEDEKAVPFYDRGMEEYQGEREKALFALFKFSKLNILKKTEEIKPLIDFILESIESLEPGYQALFYAEASNFYEQNWEHGLAVQYARKTLSLCRNKEKCALCYHAMTTIFSSLIYQNDVKRVNAYARYFIKMGEKDQNYNWLYSLHNNYGVFYYRMIKHDKAIEQFKLSSQYAKKGHNYRKIMITLNNISIFEPDVDKKIGYLKEAASYAKMINEKMTLLLIITNMLNTYYLTGSFQEAWELVKKNEKALFSPLQISNNSLLRRQLHFYYVVQWLLVLRGDKKYQKQILHILSATPVNKENPFSHYYELDILLARLFVEGYQPAHRKTFESLMEKTIEGFEMSAYFTYIVPHLSKEEFRKAKKEIHKKMLKKHGEVFSDYEMVFKIEEDPRLREPEKRIRYIRQNFKISLYDHWASAGQYFYWKIQLLLAKALYDTGSADFKKHLSLFVEYYKRAMEQAKGSRSATPTFLFHLKEYCEEFFPLINLDLKKGKKCPSLNVIISSYRQLTDQLKDSHPADPAYLSNAMKAVSANFFYDRIIFFQKEGTEFVEKVRIHSTPVLYHPREEPADHDYALCDYDGRIHRCEKCGHSALTEYMIIPLMDKNAVLRFSKEKTNGSSSLNRKSHLPLLGYIYMDKKHLVKTDYDMSMLEMVQLYFLRYLETVILENVYMRDALTSLYVRDVFMNAVKDYIYTGANRHKRFVLCMLDIDHFKEVNDLYGHQKGDEILKKTALLVKKLLRSSDNIGRYGGEEFALMFPDEGMSSGMKIAERIRKTIEESKLMGSSRSLTVSIGLAAYPEDSKWVEELIGVADKRLYTAKQQGRNRIVGV